MPQKLSLLKKLHKLWSHLKTRKKRLYIFAICLSIFGGLAEILSLGSLYPFITIVLSPEEFENNKYFLYILDFFGIDNLSNLALPVTIIFISLTIFSNLLRLIIIKINSRLAFSTGVDISTKVFEKTLSQSYENHINHNSSEFISAVTRKIDHLTGFILFPSLTLMGSFINTLAIVSTLLIINYEVALISFFTFGLTYILIGLIFRSRLNRNSKTIAGEVTSVNKSLQEGFGSIRELILYNARTYFIELFSRSDRKLRIAQGNNVFLSLSPRYILEAFGIVLIAVFTYSVSNSSLDVIAYIPLLGILALGAQRIIPAMQQIFSSWANIKATEASLDDLLDLLDLETFNTDEKINNLEVDLPFEENITFKDCRFRYSENQDLVLDNINLTISKGSSIGLIGSTGSGKTTFINVLMGLLNPTSGNIFVDGQKLTIKNIKKWQSKIALVPQDIFLSDISIIENIAFAQDIENIDFDKVKDAANYAKIHDHITSISNNYKSRVGESGISLSGGQIQRIGIARALYQEKEILIIDEGTSALDSETEKQVMKSINAKGKNLTLILIAHRLSSLVNCDYVVEFNQGSINKIYNREEFNSFLKESKSENG